MNLFHGDCLEILKTLPDNSVDSLVTDPPAGISFMGKEWDSAKGGRKEWIEWMATVMRECLRVMKPGAHGLVWAIPRTSHWTATALEDAGFEVRDVITHLFGQGFPKSLDISKAIDRAAGAEREIVGFSTIGGGGASNSKGFKDDGNKQSGGSYQQASDGKNGLPITAPSTDAAKQWSGWGTALKPASEHWILIRKPVGEKNVAANVLKWGTGGINVDGCRVEVLSGRPHRVKDGTKNSSDWPGGGSSSGMAFGQTTQGRFPANLVLSHSAYCTDEQCDIECAIEALDAQSGNLGNSFRHGAKGQKKQNKNTTLGAGLGFNPREIKFNDFGGASRFFYCAKISASERNAGLDEMPDRELATSTGQTRPGSPARLGADPDGKQMVKNHHPTVKPQKLMRYLCKLITPPGGLVLDPFMGSGSTGMAAKSEGFDFIGIEKESEYFDISKKRIDSVG